MEKHFTIRPGTGGDNDFAIGPDDVVEIVGQVDLSSAAVVAVLGGSDELGVRASEVAAVQGARRSPYASEDIGEGEVVDSSNTFMLRPSVGVEPWRLPLVSCVGVGGGGVCLHGVVRGLRAWQV